MLFCNFFEQICDANFRRPTTDSYRCFNRRTNVIGVNVTVINAVATDDNYRVTNFSPRIFKLLKFRIFEVKQEHHFVAQLADVNRAISGVTQSHFFKLLSRWSIIISWFR